ncbi:hypothetical protein PPTG_01118 [Phytophthora nicotianae INRA-310]|uniref:Protein transport protein sec16 n=1 Tax=Phytophthora nicotianae (strain INRA-310) TaxID=761204 RepID=W2RHT9_PHYN3|nr:hypothetical protein PPTG_01118 [Phytophthora nicotianae INRA-310]ETN24957.1 hypothetical protein PPTG_01118 [Phytophthora nicotianae INRA-310]
MFVKAPVELASPGGAAGEFWGDGDEDELFDHDDHADEEWDETIKDQTSSAQHMHGDSTASAFSGQDTSFSLPSQPLPPAVAESPPRQETLPVVAQETMSTSDYPASEATKISDQEEMTSAPPVTPPKLQDETAQLYSAESSLEAKPATSLDAESSPFSNAIESSVSQDTDPNVFPEAPRNARFLHTPTGTGGPFGRVPSPQGNDSGFQDEFSGAATAASTTHNAEQTHHSSMAFTDGEKAEGQDSYEDSGVRWDAGSLHSGGHGQQHEGESRQGQSDEEERDSVVSFSGENSFFPSAGRPSSLYGGSQSSFASHRMYQSSVASTDHEGSSIASFGVSSAGATFGGSERVSEGGAFSDGTMSETPSMVDSSNASTAFGTDFPSVSEGQFSAPGTTIGGSDNGSSDGGFSDGNASEATSMCESVSTNPRLVSEFNATRGHYVTETIERRDVQEPFASSAPESDSVAAFGVSEPAAASSMFGTNASADDNPFTSSPSAFNPAQHATRAPPAASNDSNFGHQAETATKEEGIQSAASLFGATAGADVPNPFSSFGAPPAAPAADTKPIEEHELPTSDAGDLFGSGPSTSAFGQPVQHASYQTHEQGYSDSGTSAFNSAQSQFASSPFDRPAAAVSSSSPFETQSSHNSADPFASRGGSTQHGFGNAAPSADSTSNKYKDPCVAPPSCLASFGFGGNVVTMFPKRKLRLNIAGSGFRNSPRGPAPPSAFDNGGNCELRKGPVNLYRMDQLHPKDKEFEQMDIFPGPLTENVSDEAILEYLDDRLKRSEAPTSADEAEDENDRLLLGILRVLVKCNGKLRSDPGTLNPSDPDSPEAQLITLLSESSKRRSGNQPPTFPPRKIQSAMHPDLMLKHANELRELLLVGDRKGAVSTAMSAHMWPEAMLIASFTDKEEYRRVLRTYLDETYAMGDPSRALFMAFADQQEKSVQEPKRLLQTNIQQSSDSLVLSAWVSHAQVLLANRTADTNKILTELGDRLWTEVNAVAAAHVCYLLAGIQVEAPMPTSKIALLGGDHRTSTEARFYVSPGAVQRTEVYEWAQKQAKGASANLMIPFQGYKLIYAMLLADHGKLETAFKYVTSMLTVIKAVTATMKPGTSMYLEGMKNQLTVLDDRLRQHLGQDRVASVAASTSRGGSRKQGKWGLGSALSIMGKIVNRVVEGNDSSTAAPSGSSASPGGLYANEATPPAASYPTPSVPTSTLSPAPSYPQQLAQQTPPQAHMTPPPSSHGPIPSYIHATPPGSAPGSSNGYNRTSASPAGPYSRQGSSNIPPSGPFSGNGRPGPQQSGPFSGNGRPGSAGPASQKHGTVPLMRSQHSMEPPGSNRSTHSNSSFHGMPSTAPQPMHQQPPSSQTSQHSQYSQYIQETPTARPALQKPAPLDLSGDTSSSSQPKTLASDLAAEVAASLPPTDAATMSGPSSDKGKASPKFKAKKSGRSKTPPPSGSSKSSGWLSGLSSFIATKMNPEAKVAKLGEQMEAYFDEETKRWIFPGEAAAEEPAMPSAPPTGPMPASAPGSGVGVPPVGSTNSAPGSMTSGPTPSNDPLAALMAPPPSHVLMKKDPLAAMMAPPSRPGMYGARRGGSTAQHKPPRPQFAVFKPSAAPAPTPDEPSE